MNDIVATAFWRRLDTDGHDSCSLIRRADGWALVGCAVFRHETKPCALSYAVRCDGAWLTESAIVRGHVGFDPLSLDIRKSEDGTWMLNGLAQPAAGTCVDLDLGFTPATNLVAIRRLEPEQGVVTPAPAAYYLEFTQELGLIEQTYRRVGSVTLAYASPAYAYQADLEVSQSGFVVEYPGLWSGTVSER